MSIEYVKLTLKNSFKYLPVLGVSGSIIFRMYSLHSLSGLFDLSRISSLHDLPVLGVSGSRTYKYPTDLAPLEYLTIQYA